MSIINDFVYLFTTSHDVAIYELKPKFWNPFGKSYFFVRKVHSNTYYGPFNSKDEAIKATTPKAIGAPLAPAVNKLIKVDFKTRKRTE